MLKYNKKNQPYEIVSRFRILESDGVVEYCRIKFFNTGYETTFKTSTVNTLDFEDTSLIEVDEPLKEYKADPKHFEEDSNQILVIPVDGNPVKLVVEPTNHDASGGVIYTDTIVQDDITSIIGQINASPAHITDGATSIDLNGAVHATPSNETVQDDITSITSFSDLVDIAESNSKLGYDLEKLPSNTGEYVVITATSPEGKEIEIQDAIGEFCAHYKLDMEAVESCIAGEQKTHKKWKFKTV